MAYLIKIASGPTYWSDREDAVWVDQASEGKVYSTKKEATDTIKEISEVWSYTLEAIKVEDAPSVERPVVEESEEVTVVDETLTTEDVRRLNS